MVKVRNPSKKLEETVSKGCSVKLKYVEPALFLSALSTSIFDVISTDIIELQYCSAVLGSYDESLCLNKTASHFTGMQKYLSNFLMYQMIGTSIFPAIVSVFLGPWSDTYGRRPLLLCSSFGRICTVSLWTWGSNTNLHPNYFLLFDAPFALAGGGTVIWLAAFCYVCDVTTAEVRAFRLGVMICVFNIASLIGMLLAPYIRNISYTFTLSVSVIASSITFLYISIFLKESVSTSETQRKSVLKNPFHWSHIKSIYESCYIKQHPSVFKILVYVGLFQSISAMQFMGENTIFYLFLQKALGWTLVEFTHLLALMLLVHVMDVVAIPVHIFSLALAACLGTSETLGLADMEIVNLTVGIRLLSALAFYFGQQNWLVYVTTSLTSSGGVGVTVIKNFLSKMIHSDDIGKVFALTGLLEALTGAPIGSPIYNLVYRKTMDTFPKAVFLVSAFLCLLMALITAKIVNFCLRSPNDLQFVKSSPILSVKVDENDNVVV